MPRPNPQDVTWGCVALTNTGYINFTCLGNGQVLVGASILDALDAISHRDLNDLGLVAVFFISRLVKVWSSLFVHKC